MVLIVVGGLGFFVWEDIARARSWKRLGVHLRIVIVTSAVLIVLMYLGRVGIMTIGIATMMNRGRTAKIRYPEERIMIG